MNETIRAAFGEGGIFEVVPGALEYQTILSDTKDKYDQEIVRSVRCLENNSCIDELDVKSGFEHPIRVSALKNQTYPQK